MICHINSELQGSDAVDAVLGCGLFFEEKQTKRSNYYFTSFGRLKRNSLKPVFEVEVFPQSKKVKIRGNLHYYFNQGKHNANDFYFQNVCECINEICAILHISPNKTFLRGFEFGVNINLAFPLKMLFESLLCLKNVNVKKKEDTNIDFYVFEFKQYYLKFYDKGAMADIEKKPILRFEVHVSKMQWIQKYIPTIQTLADLQNINNFHVLQKILLELVKDVLIIEQMETLTMKKSEQTSWQNLTEKRNWIGLSPEQRRNKKKSFETMTTKFKTSSYKEDLYKLIFQKTDELLYNNTIKLQSTETINYDLISHDFTEWENTNNTIKLPNGKISNEKLKPHDFTEWEHTIDPIKLPLEIKGKKMELINLNGLNILHGSFIGKTGKFYIQNPIQKNRIATYESEEHYNKRLSPPYYINRNEAESDFSSFLPIDLNILKTVRI